MKRILLYGAILFGALTNFNQSYSNSREKVFVFDMDEVFVKARKWHIGTYFLTQSFTMMPSFVWKKLTNQKFRKQVNTIFAKNSALKDSASYNNSTFKLVELARIYKPLQKRFDTIMNHFHHSGRSLIKSVIPTIKKLKDQGYTIIVATNRDRMGFELTAKQLQFDQLYNGKRLFDAVIVGGAKDYVQATTINGKRFSQLTPNPAYDDYIIQAAAFKPHTNYYKVVRDVVDNYVATHTEKFDTTSPAILFFDDKSENIKGAAQSKLNITAYHMPNARKGKYLRKNASQALGITL